MGTVIVIQQRQASFPDTGAGVNQEHCHRLGLREGVC